MGDCVCHDNYFPPPHYILSIFSVNAGETVKIERTKVTTTGKAVYSQVRQPL